MTCDSEPRIGKKIPTSWTKLSFDTPPKIAARFRELAREDIQNRGGGVKLAGTAASALWVSLPTEVRRGFLNWVQQVEQNPDLADSPEQAAVIFAGLMKAMLTMKKRPPHRARETEVFESGWYVERILDPEILGQMRKTGTAH